MKETNTQAKIFTWSWSGQFYLYWSLFILDIQITEVVSRLFFTIDLLLHNTI